ncbi:MAG: GNAT family N-acetyltransferase [Chlamydiales bacterium]|nr:GNAT family N-acetyltransferase [Chlamydiales bacterium]
MEYFPSTLSRDESAQMMKRMQNKIQERGWGWWAVSLIENGKFIGFVGMNDVDQATFPAPFRPAVEVGWRLAPSFWGKGYATEGALACLKFGFEILNLKEIVAYTALKNRRSRAVMERIGMQRASRDDFYHPKLPKEHPISRLVLYRIGINHWRKEICKI